MKVKYLSKVVLQRRKELGVSQKMVCDGLCTIMTLSRFESGKQSPSWDCTVAILQRLGLPNDRICAHLTREETRRELLRKEVHAFCSRFEQTIGEEQRQACVQASEKLHDLEQLIKQDDNINQQFILRMQATLFRTDSPQEQLDLLMKAIRLTVPRFDIDELSKCLYCADEVAIINKIAINYFRCEQQKKAIDIYEHLLKLVLKRTPNHKYLPLITYNYARYLGLENRLVESLETSELGREICITQGHYHMLPRFLHTEAECYYLMKERSKSIELFRAAYHIYGAIMDEKSQESLKIDVKKRFNLVL